MAAHSQRNGWYTDIKRYAGLAQDPAYLSSLSVTQLTIQAELLTSTYSSFRTTHERLASYANDAAAQAKHHRSLLRAESLYVSTAEKLRAAITDRESQVHVAQQIVPYELQYRPDVGKFDGTPAKWPAFRDLFIAEVHSRNIDNVRKLLILQKACTNQAAAVLGDWYPVADNYAAAWQLLCQKYDDVFAIKQNVIGGIFKLQPIHEETYDGLTHIVNVINNTLRQLAAMQVEVHTWDVMIINWGMSILPGTTVDSWEQKRQPSHEPSLPELLEHINARARGRVACEQTVKRSDNTAKPEQPFRKQPYPPKPNHTKGTNYGSRQPANHSSTAKHTPSAVSNTHKRKSCSCTDEHFLTQCPQFIKANLAQRKEMIKKTSLCHVCLRDHPSNECRYRGCFACNGEMHNYMLCPRKIAARLEAASRQQPAP